MGTNNKSSQQRLQEKIDLKDLLIKGMIYDKIVSTKNSNHYYLSRV
jgi:hypothetical protein